MTAAWRGIVGRSFTSDQFEQYVATLKFGIWRPRFIVVHNTSAPDTKTWQNWQGRTPPITDEKWARNLVGYYRDEERWAAGPHLFITPKGILAFTPLTVPGTHSPAWNSISWGVETVGEFERDAFAGAIRGNLIAALAILHAAAGLQPRPYELGVRGMHFHKEDPITTHKSCPGRNMVKADLVSAVEAEILRRHGGGGHPHALLETDFTVGDTGDVGAAVAVPVAAAPVARAAPGIAAAATPGDPELYSVQSRLKAMNYNPGLLTGVWGGMTAGAISGFINDRDGFMAAPTSLDMFEGCREEIKAELARAEAKRWKRPVTPARANAEAATVAAVAPEVVPVKANRTLTIWGALCTFFAGLYKTFGDSLSQGWDFITDHRDDIPTDPGTLQTAWGYVTGLPAAVWIFAGAAGFAVLAIKAHSSVKQITEQVQTGARQ